MPEENDTKATIPKGPPRSHRVALVAAGALVFVALDLWTKAWAWESLRTGPPIVLIERWAYLEFGFNTGSAFSLLRDAAWARGVFIVVTILALLYMGKLTVSLPTKWTSGFVAIALVSAGALGNLHDRIFRTMEVVGGVRHGVVDFIKVYYWPGKAWPTFNVADISLVVGVGLLLIYLSRHGDALDAKKKKAVEDEAPADEAAQPSES